MSVNPFTDNKPISLWSSCLWSCCYVGSCKSTTHTKLKQHCLHMTFLIKHVLYWPVRQVEQNLPFLLKHTNLPQILVGVLINQSWVFYIMLCVLLFIFSYQFWHGVVNLFSSLNFALVDCHRSGITSIRQNHLLEFTLI